MKYIIQNNKIKRIDISGLIIKGFINNINKEKRVFSGWGSVSIVDKQGDLIPIKEFRPVMEKLMARNAPVTDSHSNHVIGRIINYEFKPTEDGHDGLYLTAEIFNHYPTDEQAWEKIKSGEFSGFSLGGRAGTKTPQCTNIGCYNVLGDIEAWEFSVVSTPANSLASIDKVNKLAKSDIKSYIIKDGHIIKKPFAGYKDFKQCVSENKDKGDPNAYCGAIKHKVEKKSDEEKWLDGEIPRSQIEKGKVYVDNPQDAPKDKRVQEGERGGLYYESEGQITPKQDIYLPLTELYNLQDTIIEHAEPKDNGNVSYFIEAAGDIYREVSGRQDGSYIREKLNKLKKFNELTISDEIDLRDVWKRNIKYKDELNIFEDKVDDVGNKTMSYNFGKYEDRKNKMIQALRVIKSIIKWGKMGIKYDAKKDIEKLYLMFQK